MTVRPHYGEAFAQNATPEEIAHEIGCIVRTLAANIDTLKWLMALQDKRSNPPKPLVIILGLASHAAEVVRQRELTPSEYVIVSPRGNAHSLLRGLSGPIEVLTHESWGHASAKLMEEVEHHLAIIRATSVQPAEAPAQCPAHGRSRCAVCSLNPGSCAGGSSPGCGYWAATGMHWDTCPNRVEEA